MQYSSLSAVNCVDKQDPSLVGDISRLHEHFTKNGYFACGMFWKSLQYFNEGLLDKTLDPYQRAYRVWWARTFFTVWHENSVEATYRLTAQTYKDLVCACDGLILYFQLLKDKFPDAEIVCYYLGSDPNEQVYAYIRNPYLHTQRP